MNRRRVAVAAGVALLAGAITCGALVAFAPQATLDITAEELQARIDARFPQRNCALMMACLTLSTPRVALAEGSDRIGLSAAVLVSLGRREMPGQVAFSGVLRYVSERGEFFLDDLRIDNFQLVGFPPDLVEVVKARGPGALARALDGHPVYTLRADTAQHALARLAVRDIRVVDGKARVTFTRFGFGR